MANDLISPSDLAKLYASPATMTQLQSLAPQGADVSYLLRSIVESCSRKPALLECTHESLIRSAKDVICLNLPPDGAMQLSYFVPRWNWKLKKYEATFQISYRGWKELTKRTGLVQLIDTQAVYVDDGFHARLGDDPGVDHVPNLRSERRTDKDIVAVYSIVSFYSGAKRVAVLSRAEVEAHKEQYSDAWRSAEFPIEGKDWSGKKDSPWHTAWKEQALKTVFLSMVRRNEVPVSAEAKEYLEREMIAMARQSTDGITAPALPSPVSVSDRVAANLAAFGEGLDRMRGAGAEPDPKPKTKPVNDGSAGEPASDSHDAAKTVEPGRKKKEKEQPKAPAPEHDVARVAGLPIGCYEALMGCDTMDALNEACDRYIADFPDKEAVIMDQFRRVRESWKTNG